MKSNEKGARKDQVTIRLASEGDAERISVLCQQLGYPASQDEVQRRLDQIQQDEKHAVYVAERLDGYVLGWIHVYVCKLVETDPRAEIGGLVVDEDYRRRERKNRHKEELMVPRRSDVVPRTAHIPGREKRKQDNRDGDEIDRVGGLEFFLTLLFAHYDSIKTFAATRQVIKETKS